MKFTKSITQFLQFIPCEGATTWRSFAPIRLLARPCPSFLFSFSSGYSSHAPPSFSRRQKKESLRVSVWWNFEDCGLPSGVNVTEVIPAITKALRANGTRGPIEINAFGDILKLPNASLVPLHSTAINFNHTLHGEPLILNLMSWVSRNPPPAHLFLISSDSNYAGPLNRLKMNNYNILLASIEDAPDDLRATASVVWNWNQLFKRENLIGIHVNCPPYGSIDSQQYKMSHNAKVLVFWDFKGCNLPAGVDVVKVAPAINAALRANGIYGPIQITAFGDVLQLASASSVPLHSTGINFIDIPNGGRAVSSFIMSYMITWSFENTPPAHLFVIGGTDDHDYSDILHKLRMRNYNILFASNVTASVTDRSAASIVWHCHLLVRGENLVGTHFNYPPDGPYDSWYGHFKAPIEDPFSTCRNPTSLK